MKPMLKELLKPKYKNNPAFNRGCFGVICCCGKPIIDTWILPFFEEYENSSLLKQDFKEFVVQALNEKWEVR